MACDNVRLRLKLKNIGSTIGDQGCVDAVSFCSRQQDAVTTEIEVVTSRYGQRGKLVHFNFEK